MSYGKGKTCRIDETVSVAHQLLHVPFQPFVLDLGLSLGNGDHVHYYGRYYYSQDDYLSIMSHEFLSFSSICMYAVVSSDMLMPALS